MKKVLIIDPSMTAALFQAGELKKELNLEIVSAKSMAQTLSLLEENDTFEAAIVEPALNDAPEGSVIDLLLEHKIPVLVYTSLLNANVLDAVIHKPIVDYVIKSSRNNFSIIITLLSQVLHHQKTAVLIVDDSATSRMQMRETLANLNFTLLEATGVNEALETMKTYPEIKLVLTDYNMDGKNGIDLTCEIRKKYNRKELSIIGNSVYGSTMLSADFLKHGANDFINKPYQKEELVNRVLIQLDMIEYIETIKDASEKDFLTAIYNRKYVYEMGRKLFDNAKRGHISLACAMIDIDHFKRINDTYGHDVGDRVIVRLAQEISTAFRKSDIVGRLGGEEFCVVLSNPDITMIESMFDALRDRIAQLSIHGKDEHGECFTLQFTVSIGVTTTLAESFEEMLKFADLKLYEAKNYGRNIVVI